MSCLEEVEDELVEVVSEHEDNQECSWKRKGNGNGCFESRVPFFPKQLLDPCICDLASIQREDRKAVQESNRKGDHARKTECLMYIFERDTFFSDVFDGFDGSAQGFCSSQCALKYEGECDADHECTDERDDGRDPSLPFEADESDDQACKCCECLTQLDAEQVLVAHVGDEYVQTRHDHVVDDARSSDFTSGDERKVTHGFVVRLLACNHHTCTKREEPKFDWHITEPARETEFEELGAEAEQADAFDFHAVAQHGERMTEFMDRDGEDNAEKDNGEVHEASVVQ